MRLRMLKTVSGAADGFTLKEYRAGEEHDIGGTHRADDLAKVFLRERWAEAVKAPKAIALPPPPQDPPPPAPSPVAPSDEAEPDEGAEDEGQGRKRRKKD